MNADAKNKSLKLCSGGFSKATGGAPSLWRMSALSDSSMFVGAFSLPPAERPNLLTAYSRTLLALEPRIMLDGAAVATAVEAVADQVDGNAVDQSSANQGQDEADVLAVAAQDFVPPAERENDGVDSMLVIDAPQPRQIVFVDAVVSDADLAVLTEALDSRAEIIRLDSGRDGLSQMVEALSGRSDVAALHILSHGADGQVQLGDVVLTSANLDQYAEQLASIGSALSDDGDILFYGCNLGASDAGVAFVDRIAVLSNADVAASDDLTGAASLGGDWDLEIQRGEIQADMPFSAVALADYSSVLAITGNSGTVDFANSPQAGSFAGGAGVNVTYTSGGHTFVFDGTTESTYISANTYMNTSDGETKITISLQSGNVFNITSIDIQNQAGAGNDRTFTISSNIGGSVSSGAVADSTFKTVALSGANFTGISKLYVTIDTASYFAIDNLVVSNISSPNNAPTLTGLPTDVSVTEDAASNLDLSAATFADADGDSLTVTLTAGAGTMTASSGGSVTVGGSGTGTLTLAGTAANINTFLDTVTNIKYTGASNASGNDATTITVNANDGTVNPQLGTFNVDITAVNDAPTVSGVPTDVTVTEDSASNVDLSAASFADVDGNSLTVTLAVSAGTLAATTGGGVTVGGSGTGTLTLAGTAANINTFLDTVTNIKYTGAANASGNNAATLTINANDGMVNPQLGTVNLDITAVNDAPTVSGLPAAVTVVEDTASNVDLSAASFADVDGDSLTVTLAASAGTLAATTGGGVTVGGSGTGTLTLAGTAANINTFLDTLTNIKYTGASNANGNNAATLTINANDGTVNPQLGTVNVNITAVNDAPTVSGLPTDVTVTEDSASNVDLSAASFADVDGNSLTVTLAVSAGTLAATTGGGVTVGGSGTGTLTLAGTAANINTFLDTVTNIKYTGAANANGNNAATLTINANDGTVNPQLGTVNLDITAVNDAPTNTAGTAADFTSGGAAVAVLPSAIVGDIDSAGLAQATLVLSGADFDNTADVLAFVNDPATMGNIVGVFTAGTGTMTLTSAGGTATPAQFQAAVRAVTFTTTAASGTERTISLRVNDGALNSTASQGTFNIAAAPATNNSNLNVDQVDSGSPRNGDRPGGQQTAPDGGGNGLGNSPGGGGAQVDILAQDSDVIGEVNDAIDLANEAADQQGNGPAFQVEAKVIGTVNDGVVSARNTSGGTGGQGQTVQTVTSVSDAVVDARGESGNASLRTASSDMGRSSRGAGGSGGLGGSALGGGATGAAASGGLGAGGGADAAPGAAPGAGGGTLSGAAGSAGGDAGAAGAGASGAAGGDGGLEQEGGQVGAPDAGAPGQGGGEAVPAEGAAPQGEGGQGQPNVGEQPPAQNGSGDAASDQQAYHLPTGMTQTLVQQGAVGLDAQLAAATNRFQAERKALLSALG